MDIKDKVIIITGTSQGIGLAAARHLSSKGAKIVLAARSEEKLKELEQEIPDSLAVVTDMRKSEDIKNMVDKTLEKYGRIDILINNAGQGMYGPVESVSLDDFRKIMDLNVYSVLEAMQQVIPVMKKQGKGMIVNISSAVTKRYIQGMSTYSATKYALSAISSIARQELEKYGIIVSMITPKITATNFAKNSIGSRPDFSRIPENLRPQVDSAEKVAEKIEEIIKTEEPEIVL